MPKNPVIDFTNLKYVFLDRDGVLNRKAPPAQYITRPEELVILPGVEEAVAALNRAGRKVIVVTNQRGIALGLYSHDDLDRIHDKLRAQLAAHGGHLDAIYVCPHEAGQCNCRKPLTGLFERAYRDFPDATPESSVMVGDSLRDIEGRPAGRYGNSVDHGGEHEFRGRPSSQVAGTTPGSLTVGTGAAAFFVSYRGLTSPLAGASNTFCNV